MTPGVDNETLDNISQEWADQVIQQMKDRTFRFKPSSRVMIAKPNGKLRPLAIPTPKDKIVQQAYKMILESTLEPIFLPTSHGFRPNKSTHTAIYEVRKWNGITWVIEGDIKGYFDNIDHQVLANMLGKHIADQNLMDLYWKLVNAGYVNDGKYEKSFLGVPQGGVVSPLLSNLYLHELDLFMEEIIKKYSTPEKRVSMHNPRYARLTKQIKTLVGLSKAKRDAEQKLESKTLQDELRRTPSMIRTPNTGTRVYYNRYADD